MNERTARWYAARLLWHPAVVKVAIEEVNGGRNRRLDVQLDEPESGVYCLFTPFHVRRLIDIANTHTYNVSSTT